MAKAKAKADKDKSMYTIDGVDISKMVSTKLIVMGSNLYENLLQGRRERIAAQMMHDKMLTAYKLAMKDVEDTKIELLDAARDVEEEAMKPVQFLQEVNNKGKFNKYQTELKLKQLDKKGEDFCKEFKEEWFGMIEVPYWEQRTKAKLNLRKLKSEQMATLEEINNDFKRELESIKKKMNKDEKQYLKRFKARMDKMQELKELEQKTETARMGEKYNYVITNIQTCHEQFLDHMREFFNATTENDVALICSLHKELDKLNDRIPWIEAQCAVLDHEIKTIYLNIIKLEKLNKTKEIQWKYAKADQSKFVIFKRTIQKVKEEVAHESAKRAEAEKLSCVLVAESDKTRRYLNTMQERVKQEGEKYFEEMTNRLSTLMELEVKKRAKVLDVVSHTPNGERLLKNWRRLFTQIEDVTEQLRYIISKNIKAHDDIINVVTAKVLQMTNKEICKIPYISEKLNKNPANLVAINFK
jgi:hypothetical protein